MSDTQSKIELASASADIPGDSVVDIAIMGGGIAGLWLLNSLCNQGYNAILFEQSALGSQQTVASQGMIHGGIKYTLGGALSGASEAIADMPDHWRRCLRGEGDVDLTGANILSDHFYLWSAASTASKISTFLASKVTRGRVDKVKNNDLPDVFQHQDFAGTVYRLVDMVMDTPSLVATLAKNYQERIFLLPPEQTQWLSEPDGTVRLNILEQDQARTINAPVKTSIKAAAFIFAAGAGNAALLEQVGADNIKMQRRPLQQVMVKHRYPHGFFGHCLGAEKTPRLTISSYPCSDGAQIWYLGGSLAEKGVQQTEAELIAAAQRELKQLMPWINFDDAQWATLAIDRAEPKQRNFARPDKAFAAWAGKTASGGSSNSTDNRTDNRTDNIDTSNVIAAWPTKLTLCPNLGTEVSQLLNVKGIKPSANAKIPALELPTPPFALSPWDTAFT